MNDDASFRQVKQRAFGSKNESFAIETFLAQAQPWFDSGFHAVDVCWCIWFIGENVICCEVFGVPLQRE